MFATSWSESQKNRNFLKIRSRGVPELSPESDAESEPVSGAEFRADVAPVPAVRREGRVQVHAQRPRPLRTGDQKWPQ
jgi:hypothetical protein